ncbi:CHAT domain-containing protein [Nocardioides ganghwensis]|uniref:CHAT domain-containing protein n=1 Tax=Nocardioides ganghwensis TaxID=252230 RepID=A0A4Q2SD56_9ACTN|nr:CHAT domain-containing protein [Nocardioides ganghwensis]MBD3946716.1 CHAT domain-containing protein [Nocardioides ganghwensis]RYC02933.1 CHAT domain-containing protein [Nocardioides ganghwensis]
MSTVDSWISVCESLASIPSADDRRALVSALASLGLAEADREVLLAASAGRGDRAEVAGQLAAQAPRAAVLTYAAAPSWTDDEVDRATAAAQSVRAGAAIHDPADLSALPPDLASALVSDLLSAGDDGQLDLVVAATAPHRYPTAPMIAHAATLPVGARTRDRLVVAVAATPEILLLRGAAEVLARQRADARDLAAVLTDVGRARHGLAAAGPYRWWGPDGTGARSAGAERDESGPVWRSGSEEGGGLEDGGDGRRAYPRLDVVTGTSRPDVIVVDQPFEVTLGLQQRKDRALVATPAVTFPSGETVVLEVVLLHDPDSIEVTASPRATLTVGDDDPYPSVTLTCTARYGEDLGTHRRLGLQIARDGQVVAVAWRTIIAVDTPSQVDLAAPLPMRDTELVDLAPLLTEDAPDLLVSVCRGDTASSWIWSAFAVSPQVEVPDLPSSTTLEGDIAGFALETRRSIAFSADASADFLGLAGRARRIGRAIPPGIQEAVRAVATAPGRDRAPAVLLLTEELVVPWELACLEPRLVTPWGGDSPFLGAHVAVGRWPLTEHRPRPRPRTSVSVRTGAVLTADYTGVPGWGRLDHAVAEAAEVARLFDPPAVAVAPELWTVIDLFRGLPTPADVLHLALHGQYDAAGGQEGIVLLARSSATGSPVAQFLTPAEVENGALDHGPLVFLNACQVGSDERVLGDYAGFASTLLRIGATAVVAPLWNIRDDVASSVARRFYAATLGPDAVPVAEVVRALRATYTEQAVRAGDPELHATLVAYQVFGHPRLRLRPGGAPGPGATAPDGERVER